MPVKLSTEEYVKSAKKVHGELFSYDDTKYINSKINIEVRCNLHDHYFKQKPGHHLYHNGCSFCRKEKSQQTLMEKYGADHPSKITKSKQKLKETWFNKTNAEKSQIRIDKQNIWNNKTEAEKSQIQIKKEKTYIERYGYSNPFGDSTVKSKIASLRTARGDWTPTEQLSPLGQYKRIVWRLTEKMYAEHIQEIDPERMRGPNFHLDHIVAITTGFRTKIDPDLIADHTNLQMLTATENRKKGNRII